MKLFHSRKGQGKPLVIIHGLFGSSDNWLSLSNQFSKHFEVFSIDLRNHGRSPHSDDFDYRYMCDDLETWLAAEHIQSPLVIGHSLGGKVAMNLAIRNPALIARLVVVDILPKAYPMRHQHILDGLASIPVARLTSRQEADQWLATYVDDIGIRQFLLKNLARTGSDGFQWKVNIPAIRKNMDSVNGGLIYEGTYPGEVLFVVGTRSGYFVPGDEALVEGFFPHAQYTHIDAGHWVHAEQPTAFFEQVLPFLKP